jgi:hypothetical protein
VFYVFDDDAVAVWRVLHEATYSISDRRRALR